MISFSKLCILSLGILSLIGSIFLIFIFFLPNADVIPSSPLLWDLQEVGPLLLQPITGDLNKSPHSLSTESSSLLLITLTNYVGTLGFSRLNFYRSVNPFWSIIIILGIIIFFIYAVMSFLLVIYALLPKKQTLLLYPWLIFNGVFFLILSFSTILLLLYSTERIHHLGISFLGSSSFLLLFTSLWVVNYIRKENIKEETQRFGFYIDDLESSSSTESSFTVPWNSRV